MKTTEFQNLKAMFINCTLTKSPGKSHTELLMQASMNIMKKQGVSVAYIRSVDHEIAPGVQTDMREHGWDKDEWPELFKEIIDADILVLAGPIWLGDNSSEMKKVIERLYAMSGELNQKNQSVFYGRVGGCLITGNEDGAKHCAMNILYSLQHLGYTIPPQADAAWLGEIGPGPSYGDEAEDGTRAGFDSDFTKRNTTIMTWNLMHMAKLLKESGGLPNEGNDRKAWQAGTRFDYENPEYR